MSTINGLADCHIHMILDGEDFRSAIDTHKENGPVDEIIRARLLAYKDAGINFLRDGGDAYGVCVRAKQLAPEYGIDYRIPAFPIYKKGHYGAFLGRGFSDMKEYRELVKEASDKGADFIKIMISGIMDFDTYGTLVDGKFSASDVNDLEKATGTGGLESLEITDMINIAHDAGFAVMAHCNGAANVKAALAASVDSIEHGAYMDEECMALLAESDTVWVPTVSPIANLVGKDGWNDAVLMQIVKTQVENIRHVWFLGGIIAPGTDAGAHAVPHASSTVSEYNYLKTAINDREFEAHMLMATQQIEWKFKR